MNLQRLLQILNASHAAVYNLLLTDTTQYVFGLESSEKPLSLRKILSSEKIMFNIYRSLFGVNKYMSETQQPSLPLA